MLERRRWCTRFDCARDLLKATYHDHNLDLRDEHDGASNDRPNDIRCHGDRLPVIVITEFD